MPTVEQTLNCARSQLGYEEPGWGDRAGTQVTKFGRWYASWARQPAYVDTYWCAMFMSWTLSVAGAPVEWGGRFGNCGPWVRWLRQKGMWRQNPAPGALVFFDWDSDGAPEHIGMVEAVRPDGRVQTIEGNASISGRRDGVRRMVRRGAILGYGHLPYTPPSQLASGKAPAGQPWKGPAPSMRMAGPVKITDPHNTRLTTADARAMRWSQCPPIPRGFGGPESAAQRAWFTYYLALLARFSPGYYRQLAGSAAGKAEIARREAGPATIAVTGKMLNETGRYKGSTHGVIPTAAWAFYQPA